MFALNLPAFEANITTSNGQSRIFDILRRRFVALTPEEWVRQHFVHFLIQYKGYPSALMGNEISITLNGTTRRCDSILYSKDGTPIMIMEYKAPSIPVTQKVFTQICSYNYVLRVPYLVVSNGIRHYCCKMDAASREATFLQDIPDYASL